MNPAFESLVSRFHFFQTAYAVSDLDEAMRLAGRLYGVPQFQVTRDVPIQMADGIARAHFALAFVGATQIELIQPAGGNDAIYRRALPSKGFGMRLHHFGHWTRDPSEWQRIVTAVEASGLAMPAGGIFEHEGVALMHYFYADTTETLGHHLEFMYETPAGRSIFAQVPRYVLRTLDTDPE